MNEIGLDPGIDHLYAVRTIEEVHNQGGKVSQVVEGWESLRRRSMNDSFSCYSFLNSSLSVVVFLPLKTPTILSVTSSLGLPVVYCWL
jgi:saccharopine dehydrogenase (NADP+, L-glutamate forming)